MALTPRQKQARRLWKMRALGLSAVSLDADAAAYIAAMSSEPDTTRQGHINNLVVGLKADNVWDDLIWLSLFAAHDAQAARLDAKNPSRSFSAVNSPTFTADQGYQGNGTNAYLDSGVTPAGVLTSSDCSMFGFVETKGTSNTQLMGYRAVRGVFLHGASVATTGYLYGSEVTTSTTTAANEQFLCISRVSTSVTLNVNGTRESTISSSINTLGQTNTFRCFTADFGAYSNARLAVAGLGNALSLAQEQAFEARIRTYLTAVGAI